MPINHNTRFSKITLYLGYGQAGKAFLESIKNAAGGPRLINQFIREAIQAKLSLGQKTKE